MARTIIIDSRHFKAAATKARELGTTPQRYIHSLIDAATLTFDELLAPIRGSFRKSKGAEDELDRVVTRARKAIRNSSRRSSRK
jgi:hypothetical protein